MIIKDLNDDIRKHNKVIREKCIFCDKSYYSKIDKTFDICPNCEDSSLEL